VSAPTRRGLLRAAAGTLVASVTGCRSGVSGDGRLTFRATEPARSTGTRGLVELDGALLYVPRLPHTRPMRLVVALHGAGGRPDSEIRLFRPHAERQRLLVLAPKSTGRTWDVVSGRYGPDVRLVDRLLTQVSAEYPVDGYTAGGFSDGATYALSLGLDNGDLFDSVVALSPGFSAARSRRGRPRVFVSHGTRDQVLPIDRCSRRIVPALRDDGYDVAYVEFDGRHETPPDIVTRAARWLSA
jgi:predicted esterase